MVHMRYARCALVDGHCDAFVKRAFALFAFNVEEFVSTSKFVTLRRTHARARQQQHQKGAQKKHPSSLLFGLVVWVF
jgi:hypothetical protein